MSGFLRGPIRNYQGLNYGSSVYKVTAQCRSLFIFLKMLQYSSRRYALQRIDISRRKSLKFYALSLWVFPCLLFTWASKKSQGFFFSFATLWKVTISFVFSIHHHKTRLSHEISHLRIVWKSVNRIQIWLKSNKNKGCFTQDRCTFMIIPVWILPRIKKMF
jgi:hypothetical protein